MATKLKRYPKRPKQSAPLKSWENYEARVKEIDKVNSAINNDKKKKEQIMSRTARKR